MVVRQPQLISTCAGEPTRRVIVIPAIITDKLLKLFDNRYLKVALAPPVEAVETGRILTIAFRKVAPRRAGAKHKEDAVHHPQVMLPFRTLLLLGKDRTKNVGQQQ